MDKKKKETVQEVHLTKEWNKLVMEAINSDKTKEEFKRFLENEKENRKQNGNKK